MQNMNKIILLLVTIFVIRCNAIKPVDTTTTGTTTATTTGTTVIDPTKFLTIHIINVQQGDATLIVGPNGTTLLIDGGDTDHGKNDIVPYLQGLGITNSIDYMVNTHRHADHLGGLDEVIHAGYDVKKSIWDNGSTKMDTDAIKDFLAAATSTTAKSVQTMPLGQVIDLGGGAKATAVAVGGSILGTTTVPTLASDDENDRSVALLIQYGAFDSMMTGDLGGGYSPEDNACTGRSTDQANMESVLVKALLPGGGAALLPASGVDAMMVPHHGSESSTNRDYMNGMTPRVAMISVGAGQDADWNFPRKDIVETVLMAGKPCITAPPALVLQTDEGSPMGAKTSTAGFVAGDIVIKTNGVSTFQISGSGRVRMGSPDERGQAGINAPKSFSLE